MDPLADLMDLPDKDKVLLAISLEAYFAQDAQELGSQDSEQRHPIVGQRSEKEQP